MDSKYAFDTMLFVAHTDDGLDCVRDALQVFCLASGARINWAKSTGIVVGVDGPCTWGCDVGFTWLSPGHTCRYLGFQIGIGLSASQQSDPVLASIRRKLSHWSTMHLSLAGRALVVNQVLLASAWFIASCWMVHSGVMSQLRRLVRNFLWAGSDGTWDTVARVSWSTVIRTREDGGLGIIDPELKSGALVAKFIVRGLFPGNEPWKSFLRSAILECTPVLQVYFFAGSTSVVGLPIYEGSDQILVFVTVQSCPKAPCFVLLEEFQRQPLIWSQWVRDVDGRHLGMRTFIDWAAWDQGPASSLAQWLEVHCLDAQFVGDQFGISRGVATRILEIDQAIPDEWRAAICELDAQQVSQDSGWWGFFEMDVTLGHAGPVWARFGTMVFSVSTDCRLHFHHLFTTREQLSWDRIRVVGVRDESHRVDPVVLEDQVNSWQLWLWEDRPLSSLTWDPWEWEWPAAQIGAPSVSFFEYSVRIGRHILLRQQRSITTRIRAWLHGGLSHVFLSQFWAHIWSATSVSRRMWMIARAALLVGT